MKIQFTPNFKINSVVPAVHVQNSSNNILNYSYNPIAYRDYNVTFGERLFRKPKEFYEQDFNEKNMPKSLHKYIYEAPDSEQKKLLAPALAMKQVFEDINYLDNLDDVREYFYDEPLFAELKSVPDRKSRTGVLGELALMREDKDYENKSLFKNGKDDLGMYILRKIYFEGKSLKEINHDFQRDKSVAYEGLSDIKYADLDAFGIKFPKNAFWHSFLATRDDFPYTYKPRHTESVKKPVAEKPVTPAKPKESEKKGKFDGVKDWEIDKITKEIESAKGNQEEMKKRLKRNKSSEAYGFVAQYMSQIMSVTLERLHMSPEMKAFFEDYENPDDSQKTKFKKYWNNDELRENFSIVMKSTITMFLRTYGGDGKNEEFQELLAYADSIKPNREADEKRHEELQKEYEDIFKDYLVEEPTEEIPESAPVETPEAEPMTFEQMKKMAAEQGASIREVVLPTGAKVVIAYVRKEVCEDLVEDNYRILPKAFKKRISTYMDRYKDISDDYLLSIALERYGLSRFVPQGALEGVDDDTTKYIQEQLFPSDKINETARKLGSDFELDNKKLVTDTRQVLMELAYEIPFDSEDFIQSFMESKQRKYSKYKDDPVKLLSMVTDDFDKSQRAVKALRRVSAGALTLGQFLELFYQAGINNMPEKFKQFTDDRMAYYDAPLSKKEIKILNTLVPDAVYNFNMKNSEFLDDTQIAAVWGLAVENSRKNPVLRKAFMRKIRETIVSPDNSFLRSYLDVSVNPKIKDANTELLVTAFCKESSELIKLIAAYDLESVERNRSLLGEDLYNAVKAVNKFSHLYFDQNK